MSGETEENVSGWTTDTLHSLLITRMNAFERQLDERAVAQEKAINAALASAEKAVTKAEVASEKRFDAVNEFRATLSDQAATFLSRTEYEASHKALEDRVADLADRLNRIEGQRSGITATMGYLMAAATIVISLVVVAINTLTG